VFYKEDDSFFVWGLVDQIVHFNTMPLHGVILGSKPPGLFQVVATGTGDLTIYSEYEFVARLVQDRLLTSQNDVFELGPARERLFNGIKRHHDDVLPRLKNLQLVDGDITAYIGDTWTGTLCRLLISIERYRHGGALLLTDSKSELNVKYAIEYSRLSQALINLAVAEIALYQVIKRISTEYMEKNKDLIPIDLYRDEGVARSNVHDLQMEITGCVRFISSLSCVDGALLATPDLRIRGFGVKMLTKKEPLGVYLSLDPMARREGMRAVDPNHYGMRHRSMMRYCFWHPKSIGFVISRDGEIRAMTRVKDRLVIWENLKVHPLLESSRIRAK
jgi:hypothetical protein